MTRKNYGDFRGAEGGSSLKWLGVIGLRELAGGGWYFDAGYVHLLNSYCVSIYNGLANSVNAT